MGARPIYFFVMKTGIIVGSTADRKTVKVIGKPKPFVEAREDFKAMDVGDFAVLELWTQRGVVKRKKPSKVAKVDGDEPQELPFDEVQNKTEEKPAKKASAKKAARRAGPTD